MRLHSLLDAGDKRTLPGPIPPPVKGATQQDPHRRQLVETARKYVRRMTGAVAGRRGHDKTFSVACKLARFGLLMEEARTVLQEFNGRCIPPWSEGELEHKLEDAYARVHNYHPQSMPRRWPTPDDTTIAAIGAAGPSVAEFKAMSPVLVETAKPTTEDIIDLIFPGNPLLCVGFSKHQFTTRFREDLRGSLNRRQFIVPSPMTSEYGTTKSGKPSAHTLANTGPRRFLVTEFDSGSLDSHAALLHHLATFLPLVLVVFSGGKSLHGWFCCQGLEETRLQKFMRYAVTLGADKATWTKSQFVRMPGGRRDTGAHQLVYYFNPATLGGNQ